MRTEMHVVTSARGPAPREMRAFLEAPLRRPWLVVLPFVAILGVAIAATFVVPKRYRSSSLILVEAEKIPDSFVRPGGSAADAGRSRLQTLRQEVLSRTRLEKVLAELSPYPEAAGEPISSLVELMRNSIQVSVKGNDAFSIEYVHQDPEMAKRVTGRLTTLFIEEAVHARTEQVEGAAQFIETQVEEARKNLDAHEARVARYKQTHTGTLPEQLQTNLSTLQRLQLEQQAVAENLRAAQDRVSLLEGHVAIRGIGVGVAGQVAELSRLRAELAELRSRYTEEHPDVGALKARIARLEKGSQGDEGGGGGDPMLTEARIEVNGLKAKRADLDRRIAEIQARVEATPRTEQELTTLTRDFENLNENYLALLTKKLDTQMAEKLEKRWKGEQFKVLDPANLPEKAYYPNQLLFIVAGILLGLGTGVMAACVAELLDHSIRSAGDLEGALPYPVLGTVALVKAHGSPAGAWRRTG